MTTFTSSELTAAVREIESGVQVKCSVGTFTATATASSIFLLCRVPDQATVVDFLWYCSDQVANQTYKLGVQKPEGSTSGSVTISESALSTELSTTGGQTHRGGAKLPFKVSISDECIPRFAWATATNVTATSASSTMRFCLFYTMDESTSAT